MTPPVSQKIASAKAGTIRDMLAAIASLPLASEDQFLGSPHMAAAAESYLRRAIEALLDWGRHLLAKGFNRPVAEYKAIPPALRECGVLVPESEKAMLAIAGYRNRMVHFYDEITPQELYTILTEHVRDIEALAAELRAWMAQHPDSVDTSL